MASYHIVVVKSERKVLYYVGENSCKLPTLHVRMTGERERASSPAG
jgi:hypothetical protein